MEQNPSTPNFNPELPRVVQVPSPEGQLEAVSIPEGHVGVSIERQPANGPENAPATPVASVVPVLPPVPIVSDTTAQPVAALPTVASDDDLIEKEWVAKAKKVLEETKDDPYQREQAVKQLQADYLFKRYGRKLGSL